ncbi:MAG: carbonic anhydrase [Candidatus Doudnabacteria bacterium]|nr:hypothetical protein [bacterium]MDZ4243497.1 carbonic anhydrase [Candidatus Doudnabacteria bacterium]
MQHTCQALIIHCIDFRFGKAIKKYLEDQGLLGDIDIISVAGGVKNIVGPNEPSDAEFLMKQIETSKTLHDIKQVILMNHTDCGAYGGRKAFNSNGEEREKHFSDLKDAETRILEKFPELEVKKVLAILTHENDIRFEELG